MRILSTLLFLFLFASMSLAQIAINMDKPFTNLLLHIDPLRNSVLVPSSTQNDDVVISYDGKLGLGTINPTANLTVANGTLRIADGTQADRSILTSKSDGTAYWCVDTLNSVVQKLTYTTVVYPKPRALYDVEYVVMPNFTTSNLSNGIGGASLDSSTGLFTLPAGYYMISFLPLTSTTYDFFITNMYINENLYLQNASFTASGACNTIYESSSSFTLMFSYFWNRPTNSNSALMEPSAYEPHFNINIVIEKISL